MVDKNKTELLIYELLKAIGENPERPGLKDTPKRVAKMYEEMFSGMSESPNDNIKIFEEYGQKNEIVIIKDIYFSSMCEHHLLPFFGFATVGYISKEREILGISKVARIVSCYAKRLQVQERMTREIADFLFCEAGLLGVAVFIEAEHLCMTARGIKSIGSKTKTSILKGVFESDKDKKRELYSLI